MTKNVWIDADLHHIIKVQAAEQRITIREWLERAAQDKLENDKMNETFERNTKP